MSHSNSRDKLFMAFTMLVFGTLGPFINNISFPSSFISFARAIIGSLFIGIFMAVSGHGFDGKAIVKNLKGLMFQKIHWYTLEISMSLVR